MAEVEAPADAALQSPAPYVSMNLIFCLWTASVDPHSFLGMTSSSEHAWIFLKWLGIRPEAHAKAKQV